MGQDGRELLLRSQDVEQARVDDDLASWRREEVEKEKEGEEVRSLLFKRRRRERKNNRLKKVETLIPSLPGATIALTLPGSSTTMNSCSCVSEKDGEREREKEEVNEWILLFWSLLFSFLDLSRKGKRKEKKNTKNSPSLTQSSPFMWSQAPPPPPSAATDASLLPMRSTWRTRGWLRGRSLLVAFASCTICANVAFSQLLLQVLRD